MSVTIEIPDELAKRLMALGTLANRPVSQVASDFLTEALDDFDNDWQRLSLQDFATQWRQAIAATEAQAVVWCQEDGLSAEPVVNALREIGQGNFHALQCAADVFTLWDLLGCSERSYMQDVLYRMLGLLRSIHDTATLLTEKKL